MTLSGDGGEPLSERTDVWNQFFWSLGFPVLMILLVGSVPALVVAGRSVVLHSTDGAVEHQVTDPAAPGWEAYTEPTPVALVVHRGEAGALAGVTLLSLTGERSGAVVFIPVDTVVGLRGPNAETAAGGRERTLAEIAAEGEPALRSAVESLVGLSPSDIVTLDANSWRVAVGDTGPLAVENPDALFVPGPSGGDGHPALRFPSGRLALGPADVADYLVIRNGGERDLNRLVRHELLWRAWLQAAAAENGPPSPAASTVLARYVGALASSQVEIDTLPVQALPGGAPGLDRYRPVDPQAQALLARVVPFPVGGPARRLRIRLVDGVGTLQHGLDAAAGLVARGGQVEQIGNATSFGVATTRIEYADEARRREVEGLADELGVGEIVKAASMQNGVDVVVTLGRDYADRRAAAPGGTGG